MHPIRASLCFLVIASVILIVSSISSDSEGSSPIDSGYCGPNITWTYYDDGRLIIEGSGGMYDYDDGEIMPWNDHYDSITTIYLKGMFSYDYGFCNLKNLESITTDYIREQLWFSIFDCPSFKEIVLEVEDESYCDFNISMDHTYHCQFYLDSQLSHKGEPIHITFHKFAKKEIPKEYKNEVGNGYLLLLKINDYVELPVEVNVDVYRLGSGADSAKVTILDTGEQLDTVVVDEELGFKVHRSGYILVSIESMEFIPYPIPIAIVIALIGIVGSIYYYFTRIKGGAENGC